MQVKYLENLTVPGIKNWMEVQLGKEIYCRAVCLFPQQNASFAV